tara:strand:- start:4995 stop:7649 length:2655 start_codon:yes stop_codon:yes gene_type:complete
MASQEELDREKEKNQLLKEQNSLYERQLRAQSESVSLSSSLVDSLKESMGIQSRRTQFDQNLLSLSKKINRTILDQEFATTKLSALERQRLKNQTIINSSKSIESSLSLQLTDNDRKRVDNINNRNKALNKQLAQLDNILGLDKESREAQSGAEKELRKKLAANEAYVNTSIEGLSISAQQLLFAKQNREELEKTNAERENEISNIKSIQSKMGLVVGAASGVEKALSKLGFPELGVTQAYEDTIQLGLEFKAAGKKFNAIGKFASLLGNNLKGLLSTANLLTAAIGFFVKALASTDKASGELAKNLGISYDQSLDMVSSMTDIANLSMDTFVTTEGLVKAQTQLSTALGTNAQLSSTLLVDFTKLTEQAGYSAEAATVLGQVSLATGQTAKNITTEFLGQTKALNAQNGIALNEKQLLESISKVSKGTLATFAGQTDKLASAVFKAKALGLELSQVEKIADSLLDIESSLTAEFEAEVITGKQLNLERARYFALTNEIGKVADELKNQGITQASFAKSSRIEQEAVAKAMGMSRDELGEMLLEQKAISAIGAEDAEGAREKFETLKAQYGEAEAIKRLGDETYARQLASQSVQEKFNKTVAKLQDIFVDLAAPVLAIISPFMDLLNTVMPALNLAISAITFPIKIIAEGIRVAVDSMRSFVGLFTQAEEKVFGVKEAFGGILTITTALYGITKAYQVVTSTIQGIQLAINASKKSELGFAARRNLLESKGLVKTVGTAIFSTISSFAKIPLGLGIGLGIAAVAGIASMASKYINADDLMSPGEGGAGYGKRTLMGPEGAIALNNKDTVIAGTNLFPERGNDRNLQPSGATNVTVTLSKGDIMAIANAVREGASKANINVSLDGNIVSNTLQTPMAMGARRYSV